MVATKAALSIRVDALTDADGKSEDQASSIGLENRAKLEKRLRDLEHEAEFGGVRRMADGNRNKPQQKFEMTGQAKTYNTNADVVMGGDEDLVSTQRETVAVENAVQAVLDVKEQKRKEKEERRARKKAEKEKKPSGSDSESEEEPAKPVKPVKEEKEKKRKRRESDMAVDEPLEEETEEEKKARKKAAKKAEKAAAAAAADSESPKKKKKKTSS